MMQRKNKQTVPLARHAQSPPRVTTKTAGSPKSTTSSKTTNSTTTTSAAVATVVRNTFGTSPFDKYWLNVDCCGLFCASLTYFLHIYGCYAVCFVLLPPWMSYENDGERRLTKWGILHSLIFCAIALIASFSHLKAMTTDPGSVPPDAEPLRDSLEDPIEKQQCKKVSDLEAIPQPKKYRRLCRRCNSYKPDRAHHCSICKRCIIKMDHHCPWVNNCVGIGNHKYFLLFIFYTCLSCFYSLALLIARFVSCMGNIDSGAPCLDRPSHLMVLIGLVTESILFGLFTSCMMCDQWDVVLTNVTHIDRLKGETSLELSSERNDVNEVFGIGAMGKGKKNNKNQFRPDWLSPFGKVCFPESINDDIMGFCRPCTYGPSKGGDKKEEEMELLKSNSTSSHGSSGRRNNGVAEIV